MRYMKFVRRKIKKTLTFTLVLNSVTGGKNDVKQRNVNEGFENKLLSSQFCCVCVYTKLEILILTCIDVLKLENNFHIF